MRNKPLRVCWGAHQVKGGRDYQEDYFGVFFENKFSLGAESVTYSNSLPSGKYLLVLADGMGGMGNGDFAAKTVTEHFMRFFVDNYDAGNDTHDLLHGSLHHANGVLRKLVQQNKSAKGMGCTLVAAFVDRAAETAAWISVGDSPMLVVSGESITRLNETHSWGEQAGRIFEKQRQNNPNITLEEVQRMNPPELLVSAVNGEDIALIDDNRGSTRISRGDIFIIASDGLETLAEVSILDQIRESYQVDEIQQDGFAPVAKALCHAVVDAGDPEQDNTTAVMFSLLADRELGVSSTNTSPLTRISRFTLGRKGPGWPVGLAVLAFAAILGAVTTVFWLAPDKIDSLKERVVDVFKEKDKPLTEPPAGPVIEPAIAEPKTAPPTVNPASSLSPSKELQSNEDKGPVIIGRNAAEAGANTPLEGELPEETLATPSAAGDNDEDQDADECKEKVALGDEAFLKCETAKLAAMGAAESGVTEREKAKAQQARIDRNKQRKKQERDALDLQEKIDRERKEQSVPSPILRETGALSTGLKKDKVATESRSAQKADVLMNPVEVLADEIEPPVVDIQVFWPRKIKSFPRSEMESLTFTQVASANGSGESVSNAAPQEMLKELQAGQLDGREFQGFRKKFRTGDYKIFASFRWGKGSVKRPRSFTCTVALDRPLELRFKPGSKTKLIRRYGSPAQEENVECE